MGTTEAGIAGAQVQDEAGTTRRDLIKRGAVAAGTAVWAAPVIDSFVSRAGAAEAGSPGPCPPGYVLATGYVKYEVDLGTFVPNPLVVNDGTCIAGGCTELNSYLADLFNAQIDAIVDVSSEDRVCLTIPEECTMIDAAAAKEGGTRGGTRNPCDYEPDAGSDALPGGRTVCFSKEEARGDGVSNVVLAVTCCVPADKACPTT